MLWKYNGHHFKPVNLHNAHLGVQGIIACNGPSFAGEPAERLRGIGRIVIGVNNVYPRIKPDYWHGVDTPDNFDPALFFEPFPKILRAGTDKCEVASVQVANMVNTFFLDMRKAGNVWDWSEGSMFYESRNSLLSALQFTLWLGIRDIALVGVDLSHAKGDYADGNYLTDAERRANALLHDATFHFFAEFVPQAETMGVRFTVSNQESRLAAIMPHCPIEDVLAACERDLPHGRPKLHNKRTAKPCCGGAPERNVVLVLRSGGNFAPEHVHRLVKQVGDARVTLLTDFPAGDFPGINVMPLLHGWPGWWSKMELFRPSVLPGKPFLYIDLDTTVHGGLPDSYFAHCETVVLKQFRKGMAEHKPRQCGMMLLHPAERRMAWEKWTQAPEAHMRQFKGDDDFWNEHMPPVETWQDLHPGEVTSHRFNWVEGKDFDGPLDKERVRVICFFGKPRPWEVASP